MSANAVAVAQTFDAAIQTVNRLVERGDVNNLRKMGEAVARGCTRHTDMSNVRAMILEYARAGYTFLTLGIEFDTVEELTPLFIEEGTYTIAYPDSDETFTFRVRTVKTGKLAGRTVVDYLKGQNFSALDFETFAFVNEHSLNVFFCYERLSGASGWLVNKAREIEKLIREGKDALDAAGFAYAQKSNRCRFCNKVLTDEASKAAGCGITCAVNHGIAHAGLAEKRARKGTEGETNMIGVPEETEEPSDEQLARIFPAAKYERWTSADYLCEYGDCDKDALPDCQYCRAHALFYAGAGPNPSEPDWNAENPYAHMSLDALEDMLDGMERESNRMEDCFGNPKTSRELERQINAVIAELNRRAARSRENMTIIEHCPQCKDRLVSPGSLCADCELENRQWDRVTEKFDM